MVFGIPANPRKLSSEVSTRVSPGPPTASDPLFGLKPLGGWTVNYVGSQFLPRIQLRCGGVSYGFSIPPPADAVVGGGSRLLLREVDSPPPDAAAVRGLEAVAPTHYFSVTLIPRKATHGCVLIDGFQELIWSQFTLRGGQARLPH